MKFVWGIIAILIGLGVIKYTYQIVQTFGKISWAEEHLKGGFGGTYTLIKLSGLILIVLSLIYMFGAVDFLVGPLAPIFGGSR